MRNITKDLYLILKINRDASAEQIRSQYKKLALEYHPDRNVNLSAQEKSDKMELFKQVQSAYETLANQKDREKYNKENPLAGFADNSNKAEQPSNKNSNQNNSNQYADPYRDSEYYQYASQGFRARYRNESQYQEAGERFKKYKQSQENNYQNPYYSYYGKQSTSNSQEKQQNEQEKSKTSSSNKQGFNRHDFNHKYDKESSKEFYAKIESSDLEWIKKIVNSKGFPLLNHKGLNPLEYAAYLGNENIVKLFINESSSLQSRQGNQKMNAIELAAIKGHINIVEILKKSGQFDLTERNNKLSNIGNSDQFYAAKRIYTGNNDKSYNVLEIAILKRNLELVKKIVKDYGRIDLLKAIDLTKQAKKEKTNDPSLKIAKREIYKQIEESLMTRIKYIENKTKENSRSRPNF